MAGFRVVASAEPDKAISDRVDSLAVENPAERVCTRRSYRKSAPKAGILRRSDAFLNRLKGEVQTNRVAVTGILLERIRRTRSAALVAKIAVKVAINLVTKIQQDIIRVCRNQMLHRA